MDTVVLSSLLNGALLLVCLGLLLSFCVSCGQSWRQTSIHQFIQDDHPNEVYNPGDFRVVRPMPPSSLRSPWQEPERRPSYTPTEDDDDSYVNQDNDDDNDADGDKQGYINVLMDKASSMPENSSQPSLSSATVDSNRYNHVPSPGVSNTAISLTPAPSSLRSPCQEPERRTSYTPTEDDDDNNYVNMLDHEKGGLTPGMSQESMESDGNGSTEYVNTSPK